eukprot:CAMPEP_0194389520 /NCGR_PEP_ID=MMETSP0174-20130528/104529_1 /TAXON_ID=216777 /ORGANISM="Proboscia alata, Strain PI-D3" /LENGTH=75 /DNA_ID=CAMNT_0039181843 /DNA_START=57 /DNA_END=285 /DNA_ORIENTATION=-
MTITSISGSIGGGACVGDSYVGIFLLGDADLIGNDVAKDNLDCALVGDSLEDGAVDKLLLLARVGVCDFDLAIIL